MKLIKVSTLIFLTTYWPLAHSWEDDDYSHVYDETDGYTEQPAYNAEPTISAEVLYQLAARRQIQAMQDQMLDNARHQQNLHNIRERGEQWAKSFKNPYMD